MTFSGLDRGKILEKMSEQELDLLIIGGGITGAGIALDSSLRGMNVGLVEMQDFASGTSSRSTKLVHGGLRYLKNLDFKIVAEVGKERAIVYENAPHVTSPEKMILPFYKGGTFGKFSTSLGLKMYDFLAGVKKSERRYMLSREQTLQKEPLLKKDGLAGSGIYVEYKTDDARLTLETLKKAVEKGAKAVNYSKAEQFLYQNNRLSGVVVKDLINNKEYNIYAKKIVSATGPWVDNLRRLDNSLKEKHLLLTKGTHLIFDQKRFPLIHAIYFDTHDKRMVFAIPREGKTYLGTTDTFYDGDLVNPRMTVADRNYLLSAANNMFPTLKLTAGDIESSWAGIRALIHTEGKAPSEISRRDEIFISDSGLISIAGGKLTGYRIMAAKIVDLVVSQLKKKEGIVFKPCQTRETPLSGGDVDGSAGFKAFIIEKIKEGQNLGLSEEEAENLIKRYGSNINHLYKIIKETNGEKLSGLPKDIYAALKFGLDNEMVVTPLDFFHRRTGALLFNRDWVVKWKDKVIDFMAEYYSWEEDKKEKYQTELEKELKYTVTPV